jgi:hypothetical protein
MFEKVLCYLAVASCWSFAIQTGWALEETKKAIPAPIKIMVPPPPVNINVTARLNVLETKLDAIAGMVRFLYRRQIVDDAATGHKTLTPDIKLYNNGRIVE